MSTPNPIVRTFPVGPALPTFAFREYADGTWDAADTRGPAITCVCETVDEAIDALDDVAGVADGSLAELIRCTVDWPEGVPAQVWQAAHDACEAVWEPTPPDVLARITRQHATFAWAFDPDYPFDDDLGDVPTCGQLSGRCECEMPHCEPMPLPCYVCTREAGGDPFGPDSSHPKRNVVRTRLTNPADPTMAYELTCGHTII